MSEWEVQKGLGAFIPYEDEIDNSRHTSHLKRPGKRRRYPEDTTNYGGISSGGGRKLDYDAEPLLDYIPDTEVATLVDESSIDLFSATSTVNTPESKGDVISRVDTSCAAVAESHSTTRYFKDVGRLLDLPKPKQFAASAGDVTSKLVISKAKPSPLRPIQNMPDTQFGTPSQNTWLAPVPRPLNVANDTTPFKTPAKATKSTRTPSSRKAKTPRTKTPKSAKSATVKKATRTPRRQLATPRKQQKTPAAKTPRSAVRTPKRTPRARREGCPSPFLPNQEWLRQEYAPFAKCKDHSICKKRGSLSEKELLNGWFYRLQHPSKELTKTQMLRTNGEPWQRNRQVADSVEGRFNLAQLHLARAFECADEDRRPLLFPNLEHVESPIRRLLVCPKLFCGRFFTADGGCQREECILLAFPKYHRGSVRLQLKVYNTVSECISTNAARDDCKAQYLSYVCWLFGILDQKHSGLGQWPNGVATCKNGRSSGNRYLNEEFMCINPFHYTNDESAVDEESDSSEQAFDQEKVKEGQDQLQRKVQASMNKCFAQSPALIGEQPNPKTGRSYCFCVNCRKTAEGNLDL